MVDLSEIDARDQFEIITHENNEAAFFASSVLLVEGPSDRTLLTHIARTLNPQWDFDKHGAAIAKVEGRGASSGTAVSSSASRCVSLSSPTWTSCSVDSTS